MSSSTLKRELTGIALLLFAVFVAGALLVQRAPAPDACFAMRGSFVPVGTFLACSTRWLLGLPAAALLPLIPAVHALRLFGRLEEASDRSWLVFLGGTTVLLPIAIAVTLGAARENHWLGGIWGALTGFYLVETFGRAGAWILLLLAASALTAASLAWNPLRMLIGRAPERAAEAALAVAAAGVVAPDDAYTPPKRRRNRKDDRTLATLLEPTPEEMPAIEPALMKDALGTGEDDDDASAKNGDRAGKGKAKKTPTKIERIEARDAAIAEAIHSTAVAPTSAAAEELPPVELLTPGPARNTDLSTRELDAAGQKLMTALRTFKVDGELTGRTTGPTVTQFEVEPAAGVKVRQFANLANDLALAMRAASIRVVAPIPGKGAVGIEVPNPSPEMVAFRDMVDAHDFRGARAALPIALGKDLEGKPVVADLAKMPHLLIAGATGSGKSVCVNTIITSLVYRHTPKTLRFLMVDPKMVELSVYNVLPHLRHKVITDNRDAAAVLKWAVLEMNERYQLLAENGCRNIQDFNVRVQKHLDGQGQPLRLPKSADVAFENVEYKGGILPYIVVVIDEMADLMMTVQGEVETPIAMLAQKARAIGIHLILATQRPSVNVITGLIKANFPSRIAFRVASQVDSRTIIDGAGAEMLLGNGDMLFIPPGKSEPSRLQGAYLSSDDTEKLMAWYEERTTAKRAARLAAGVDARLEEDEEDILEKVKRMVDADAKGGGEDGDRADVGDRDKLFRDAAEIVIQHQGGSTSLLQRKLNVGYGRAARLIDQLHEAGVLGESKGAKGRDVLCGLEDLDRIAPKD